MKKRHIPLILVPALIALSGCTDSQVQRDVYQTKEECLADWGTEELCKDMPDDEAKQYSNNGHGSSFIYHPGRHYFWGPSYYPSDRAVDLNGRTYRPASAARPFVSISSGSRSAMTSAGRAISRGGFGATGHSSSTSGG